MQRHDSNTTNKQKSSSTSVLTLDAITQHSTLKDDNIVLQNEKILSAFNAGNKENTTVESVLFGKRIDQDEFRLIHRNNVPHLLPYTYYPRRLGVYFTGAIKEMGVFKQTKLVIGGHGRYLVNVPQGKLVKAWLGTDHPILLGEGPHVIRHPNFKLENDPVVDVGQAWRCCANH